MNQRCENIHIEGAAVHYSRHVLFNTLRTGDADLRF